MKIFFLLSAMLISTIAAAFLFRAELQAEPAERLIWSTVFRTNDGGDCTYQTRLVGSHMIALCFCTHSGYYDGAKCGISITR